MKKPRHVLLLGCLFFVLVSGLTSCRGGLCAAQTDGLLDVDSDCKTDETDNCILVYNPQQFDGDDDGVGAECDADDADEGVASLSAEVLTDLSADSSELDSAPDFSGEYVLTSTSCTVSDSTLTIDQTGADLTVTGDANGSYSAHLAQMSNGQIIFETTFVDNSTQYGVMTSAGELEVINMNGSAVCLSFYFQ